MNLGAAALADVLWPVVTMMSTGPAVCAGLAMVSTAACPPEAGWYLTFVAGTLPNITVLVALNPAPEIVTSVPPFTEPWVLLSPVTIGAACTQGFTVRLSVAPSGTVPSIFDGPPRGFAIASPTSVIGVSSMANA